MQFLIDNKILVELIFNTEPSTPTLLDLFEYVESTQIGLPTCIIKLNCRDTDMTFIQESLYDGAKIKASIKHLSIDYEYNLNLCIFGSPNINPSSLTNEGFDMNLTCILDNYKYLAGIPKNSYKGTVSNVLKQIASECNLKTQVLNTSTDSQVWYSYGRTYNHFAKHLIDHCYLSDVSLPEIVITHPNTILLRDIPEILKREPVHTLGYQTRVVYQNNEEHRKDTAINENSYIFVSYKSQNITGLYNALSTYGSVFVQNGISTSYESSAVTFSRKLTQSEINKNIKNDIREVSINYLPPNVENTYKNFYAAYAKNIRLRNLYSNLLKVLVVNEYTKIRPLDCVKVVIDLKFEDAKDEIYSGNYVVIGKTINITRNIFRELITVVNYGRNMNSRVLL